MPLAAVTLPGNSGPWAGLGFTVDDNVIALGNGVLRLGAPVAGYHGLVAGSPPTPATHPNGALYLDHVVLSTPSLETTSEEVTAVLGLPLRRIREAGAVRQGFHRFPPVGGAPGCIVEIVEREGATVGLWGVVVVVDDLAAVCTRLGPNVISEPRAAVQEGRRIATARKSAGLAVPVALMSV